MQSYTGKKRKILAEKASEMERKILARRLAKEKVTSQILYFGLWQSESEIEEGLGFIKTLKEKKDAIMSQFKFRKLVLEQKYKDKSVYSYSRKGPT